MIPPKEAVLLDGDAYVSLPDQQVALPKKGVLWVKPESGSAQWLSRPELSLTTSDAFAPLCKYTWLKSVGGSRLQVMNTERWMAQDATWASLENFHRLTLTALSLNQAKAESAERERIQQRAESERAVVDNAVTHLASLLAPEADTTLIESDVGKPTDPLLTACQWVGNALGVEIQAPASHKRGQAPDSRKRGQDQPDALARKGLAPSAAIKAIAQASAIRIRQVALKGEWWREEHGPLLGFLESGDEGGRPVALLPIAARGANLPTRRLRRWGHH